MRFALLAVVTTGDRLAKQGQCGSMSFCAVTDEYPDMKPMGYPFDRPLAKPMASLVAENPSVLTALHHDSGEITNHLGEVEMPSGKDPFKKLARTKKVAGEGSHLIRPKVLCDTESRGHATPHGMSPLELVLHAPGGFIPLWAQGTTLQWKFRESTFDHYEDPERAMAAVESLLAEAILAWGDAAPVKLMRNGRRLPTSRSSCERPINATCRAASW